MFNFPWRIFLYISSQTLRAVLGLFLILSALILLIDLIESLGEVENVNNAGFGIAMKLTFLRAPKLALSLMPFIFLFGTMWAFYQMNKRSEIAVMRSSGLSVWGIIMPSAVLSFILGVMVLSLFDPLAARMSTAAQQEIDQLKGKETNLLKEFQGGIWLRQITEGNSLVLHARSYDKENQTLSDATIWRRTLSGVLIERWDAKTVDIQNNKFVLNDASYHTLDLEDRRSEKRVELTSAFQMSDLKKSVTKADTLSVWQLPEFIELSKNAGLSVVDYRLRYNDLISLPFKLFAMVLIAAAFSMHPVRSGNTFSLILSGIGAGFLLFIFSELSNSMAEALIAPVWIAAWTPVLVAILAATTLLLYSEDG